VRLLGAVYGESKTDANMAVHMLYVEKDLSGIVKAIFDNWDVEKDELRNQYLYAMDDVHTPREVCTTIEQDKLPLLMMFAFVTDSEK
jgi:hypothetical protein